MNFSYTNDLTFFTNEKGRRLIDRFKTLFKEKAIRKFIEWIRRGKLEIKYYPHFPLHAKLHIFKSRSGIDLGRVITGSSNFTISGLKENLEFNVELKNRADVEFAINRFEALWKKCIDISEDIVKTVKERTYLNDTLSPYELYLKFLYEFFYEQLDYDKENEFIFLPSGFKKLQYQLEVVADAESKLKKHGGVFLSDVVGLGKTFIASMLAAKLQKKILVFAPPHLTEYWEDTLREFRVPAKVVSSGLLKKLPPEEFKDYSIVIIDEAHRFRNEETKSYENLHSICKGKKVILITATPYNNKPSDIKSQLLLFQNRYHSTIPGVTNLEAFFKHLEKKIKRVDRKKNPQKFKEVLKECGKEIRTKILRYVMVRRTRKEVEKFFKEDLKAQGVFFPKVKPPKKIYYLLDGKLDNLYNKTIEIIKNLSYARYRPAPYLKTKLKENDPEFISQMNLSGLMKTLLLKRLESSFEAFRKSLDRFLESHEKFLKMFEEEGKVYVSKEVDVYNCLKKIILMSF